jgi:thioredoxin 1
MASAITKKKFWHAGWLYDPRKLKTKNMMINKSNFKKHVIENTDLTLVQFKTEWNGACQIVSMIYDDLARSYKGSANFYTVDVEEENGLNNEYGISELPTILFFKAGKVIDHIVGLTPKDVLKNKIDNALINSTN